MWKNIRLICFFHYGTPSQVNGSYEGPQKNAQNMLYVSLIPRYFPWYLSVPKIMKNDSAVVKIDILQGSNSNRKCLGLKNMDRAMSILALISSLGSEFWLIFELLQSFHKLVKEMKQFWFYTMQHHSSRDKFTTTF